MKLIAISGLLLGVLLTLSCSKEIIDLEKKYPNVDPDLWSYYEEFEAEADKRGLSYDLNNLNISGEIQEIHQSGVAGSCQYGSAINNHVTIDKTFWNRASDFTKEMVVFHELGHCALLRGHDERQNRAGLCLSIMRSGTGNCIDAYSAQNRDAYLNELFSKTNDIFN